MAGYVRGRSRYQLGLPACLDDGVAADSMARAVDAFVESADLAGLGFARAAACDDGSAGRPSYDPAALAKLLLYGGLEGVSSSRRLEKECARNKEVCWLMEDVRPCFKTIANFRRDNPAALVGLCRAFAGFCVARGLIAGREVAVDGAKFHAAAGAGAVYSRERLVREMALAEARAKAYLDAMDAADAEDEAARAAADAAQLSTDESAADAAVKLAATVRRRGELAAMSDELRRSGASYCVEGEADARVMKKRGGASMPAYNVQVAVDTESKFIVHVDVTTAANDRAQLAPQAKAAKAALGAESLTVLADAGYQNASQTRACEDIGVEVVVPAHRVVNPKGKYFTRDAFTYDAELDQYTCPAGETLVLRRTDAKLMKRYYQASAAACGACALKAQCTGAKRRTVLRHLHADAQERASQRAADNPSLMRRRAGAVEHPFANIKRKLGGVGRLSMRGLENVRAEIGVSVLAYNLRRAISVVGARELCAQLAAGPIPPAPAAPRPAPP